MERILVSRQPIYRADLSELGYELLFRNSDKDVALFSDGDQATAEVIVNTFVEIGLDEMVGRHLAFINFDRNMIFGNYWECLPRERVVLEILETINPDAALIKKLRDLRKLGYRIALDDFMCTDDDTLVEVADFVKFDLITTGWPTLESAVKSVRKHPVQLIAEKVETREQFEKCRSLDFDYFQGYFFCRPQLMEGRRVPASRLATIRLITKLNNPDVELKDLEQAIGQDVSLSYKLLRFINSAIFCLDRTVNSLRHAITLLGHENIRRWASLILFCSFEEKSREIMVTGAVRGRMCEHLGKALGLPNPERLFLTGLLSVLEGVLDMPMQQIVSSLPLSPEIGDALLDHRGQFGAILRCVLEYERRNWSQAQAAVSVDAKIIGEAYRKSVGWALSTLNGFSTNTELQVAN